VSALINLTVVHRMNRSVKDAEVCKEREALESAKRSLDHRVVELEQELDTQRREITAGMILPQLLCHGYLEVEKKLLLLTGEVLAPRVQSFDIVQCENLILPAVLKGWLH